MEETEQEKKAGLQLNYEVGTRFAFLSRWWNYMKYKKYIEKKSVQQFFSVT